MDQNIIETRVARTFLRQDAILQVDTFPSSEFKLSDAVECIKAQAVLANGIRRPLLVNLGKIKSIDRESRAYLGGVEAEKNVNSTALITSSPVGRIIGNFMMGLNKTLYPTRLFTEEQEALEWLRGFLK